MLDLRLVPPSLDLAASFLEAVDAFQREGLPWWRGPSIDLARTDFAAFVAAKRAEATPSPAAPSRIPKTQLWAVSGDVFVGRIGIFHALDDDLRRDGGHIGYDTVPSWRGRGVATEMLRQALPIARALGLTEVLLTCDDTNVASIAVIEKNGGVLRATRSPGEARPLKRYYALRT